MKQAGKPGAGKRHAGFDEAGAGDGAERPPRQSSTLPGEGPVWETGRGYSTIVAARPFFAAQDDWSTVIACVVFRFGNDMATIFARRNLGIYKRNLNSVLLN